jgi:hypothetical protein
MKKYQKGGFTPPPPGVIMRDEPKTIEGFNEMMEERFRKASEAQMRHAQERGRGLIRNNHPKTIGGYNEMIQEQFRKANEAQRRQAQERGTGAILDRGNFPAKYKLGGNIYHAKMFRKSIKH